MSEGNSNEKDRNVPVPPSLLIAAIAVVMMTFVFIAIKMNQTAASIRQVSVRQDEIVRQIGGVHGELTHMDGHLDYVEQSLGDLHAKLDTPTARIPKEQVPRQPQTRQVLSNQQRLELIIGRLTEPWTMDPECSPVGAAEERARAAATFEEAGGHLLLSNPDSVHESVHKWLYMYATTIASIEQLTDFHMTNMEAHEAPEELLNHCRFQTDNLKHGLLTVLTQVGTLIGH